MAPEVRDAPGHPGNEPRWTSSAKCGVGNALQGGGRVSFTLAHGILNEVYFPRPDEACLRDMGLIVTDGRGYFSEEKRDCTHVVRPIADGVPGYELVNTSRDGRYRITKRVLADPERDVVLQQIRFEALDGATDLRVYALAAPHLVNGGRHNTAEVDSYKGRPVLFARGGGLCLAMVARWPYRSLSVGFVTQSDGYTLLKRDFALKEPYTRAADGNVALCGELDFGDGDTTALAIAFGVTKAEAAFRARSSLLDGFAAAEAAYVGRWQEWQGRLAPLDRGRRAGGFDPYRVSTAVMRVHESHSFAGGMIASLSIPFGAGKGDGDLGGYHLVWPRDLVESGGALLAMGAHHDARRVLTYLQATQEQDGHWPQNMWLDGHEYWPGIQMDETAFPIIFVEQALRAGALHEGDLDRFWPMVRQAARFIVHNGPATGQDRWEEDGGYSPFTLAVEVAALVVAAALAEELGHGEDAAYLLDTADLWNSSIERWTYAVDTPAARAAGVPGYYVRIAPDDTGPTERPVTGSIVIKNVEESRMNRLAAEIVSVDALALVRFGLRAPDDPRILNTVAMIDKHLRAEMPQGPMWYRYNEDGYGNKADGGDFDGSGVGRLWPLLTGERAHYELAAGRLDEAHRLLDTLEACANESGLLPEQTWDGDDLPDRELFRGRPAGSAMPLVWAHSEHIKLLRSLKDGQVFDRPNPVADRYLRLKPASDLRVWRFGCRPRTIEPGRRLRIETLAPARVRWSVDGWAHFVDTDSGATSFDIHVAVIDLAALPVGTTLAFTFFWPEAGTWENTDFAVDVVEPVVEPW